jgi:hypothetical protein
MNSVGSIKLSHFIVTIISLGTFFFISSFIPIEAVKKEGTLLKDYDNLKKLVDDIKNGVIDDKISLNDLKGSGAYQNADKNMQDCINLAAKIGHNLRGVEIVHCFDDANYFKNKYPDVSVPKTTVPQPEANLTANVPEANLTANVPEANLTANVPETNASLNAPETNASLNAPETNASLNAPEANASQEVSKGKMALNVTVAKDPITPGESQVVTAVASDPVTGKILDHVFIKLTIKDPIGIILKNYTATEGSVTRSFKIGYNAVGKFTILATASQAGIESRKSLPFHVQ